MTDRGRRVDRVGRRLTGHGPHGVGRVARRPDVAHALLEQGRPPAPQRGLERRRARSCGARCGRAVTPRARATTARSRAPAPDWSAPSPSIPGTSCRATIPGRIGRPRWNHPPDGAWHPPHAPPFLAGSLAAARGCGGRPRPVLERRPRSPGRSGAPRSQLPVPRLDADVRVIPGGARCEQDAHGHRRGDLGRRGHPRRRRAARATLRGRGRASRDRRRGGRRSPAMLSTISRAMRSVSGSDQAGSSTVGQAGSGAAASCAARRPEVHHPRQQRPGRPARLNCTLNARTASVSGNVNDRFARSESATSVPRARPSSRSKARSTAPRSASTTTTETRSGPTTSAQRATRASCRWRTQKLGEKRWSSGCQHRPEPALERRAHAIRDVLRPLRGEDRGEWPERDGDVDTIRLQVAARSRRIASGVASAKNSLETITRGSSAPGPP